MKEKPFPFISFEFQMNICPLFIEKHSASRLPLKILNCFLRGKREETRVVDAKKLKYEIYLYTYKWILFQYSICQCFFDFWFSPKKFFFAFIEYKKGMMRKIFIIKCLWKNATGTLEKNIKEPSLRQEWIREGFWFPYIV